MEINFLFKDKIICLDEILIRYILEKLFKIIRIKLASYSIDKKESLSKDKPSNLNSGEFLVDATGSMMKIAINLYGFLSTTP